MKLKIFILTIALMLAAPFAGLCQLNQGLIAWYPFNGNASDASGNGLNGTLHNSPSFVGGPVSGGEAIHLIGQESFYTSGQYVTIPSIDLSGLSQFTISLWADIQGDSSGSYGEFLIGIGAQCPDITHRVGIVEGQSGSGTYNLGFYAGSGGVSLPGPYSYSGSWHRYSMVYANGVMSAYIDGQVVGTANCSIASTAGDAGMGIHWWCDNPYGVSTRFIGSLSDVRIYNRALSSQEIQALSSVPPSIVSAANSSLTATPSSAPADGTSKITATVTLRDINNIPVAGKTVSFSDLELNNTGIPVTLPGILLQPTAPTGNSGQASATIISSTTPGTVFVWAKDVTDNVSVQQTATAQFTPPLQPLPNPQLQSAIEQLYNGSAGILNGTPQNIVTGQDGQSLSEIATEEGVTGHYFYEEATANAFQTLFNSAFYAIGAVTGDAGSLLKSLAQAEGLTIANTAIDQVIANLAKNSTNNSGILVTRAQHIATACNSYQLYLQSQERSILAGVPSAANDQSQNFSGDFARRRLANNVIQALQQQVCAYYFAISNESSQAYQGGGNIPTTLLKNVTGTGGSTILSTAEEAGGLPDVTPDMFSFFQDTVNLKNLEYDNFYAYWGVESALYGCLGSANDISNNVQSAFAEIVHGFTPGPTGDIVGNPTLSVVTDSSVEPSQTIPGTWKDYTTPTVSLIVIKDIYCDMSIENRGSTEATFVVYAFYSYSDNSFGVSEPVTVPNVLRFAADIGAQQPQAVHLDFGSSASLSSVQVYMLAYQPTGIFYCDTRNLPFSGSSSQVVNAGPIQPLGPKPNDSSSNSVTIENPIKCYVNQDPSNQTYQAQIWTENPFVVPLTVTVTQSLLDGSAASDLSTNGTLQGSSIVWTNCIAPSNSVENTFTFSLPVTPGVLTNLPPPTVVFSDTNGNSLSLQGDAPNFNGLFPVQVNDSVPLGRVGVDSPMQVTVTNLTSTSQAGSLTISITDSTGNAITNFSQSFSVDGSSGTNLEFTFPGCLPAGSYTVTDSLSINGGMGQVFAGNYIVSLAPVVLGFSSTTPLDTNGFNLMLQGPISSNYMVEASTDLINWTPIMAFSATNSPFYFSDPSAANYSQRFYRAILLGGAYVAPPVPVVLGFGSAQPLTANGFSLMLQGPLGSNYVIEASADLINWQTLTNFMSTTSPIYFSDPAATNYSQRFYRVVMQ